MNNSSMITFLRSWARQQPRLLTKATVYSILNKVVLTLPEFFLGMAINVVLHAQNDILVQLGVTNLNHQLIALALFTTCLWIISSVFYYLESVAWQKFAQNIQHNARTEAYKRIQHNDIARDEKSVGNLVSIINDDINQLESFFRFAANDVIHLVVGTVMIGATYLYYAPLVAISALLPIPFIVFLSIYFQKKLQLDYLMTRNQAGKLATHLTDALHDKQFNPLQLEAESLKYQQHTLQAAKTNSIINPAINSLIACTFMLTITISGYYVLNGYLLAGTFSIIVLQTQRLLWPFARTAQIIDAFERTAASALRIQTLLASIQHAENIVVPQEPSSPEQRL